MAYLIQPPASNPYIDAKASGAVPNINGVWVLYLDDATGNDANGPSDPAKPWKTFDRAIDFISRARYPGQSVRWVLQIGPGNYNWNNFHEVGFDSPFGGVYMFAAAYNIGAAATTIINTTHALRFLGSYWQFDYMTINIGNIAVNDWHPIYCAYGTHILFTGCTIGLDAGVHDTFNGIGKGSLIECYDCTLNYKSPGMTVRSIAKLDNCDMYINTLTVNNPPTFNEGCFTLDDRAYLWLGGAIATTGTGSFSGKRYSVLEGSMLLTYDGSPTSVPGTVAGNVGASAYFGPTE